MKAQLILAALLISAPTAAFFVLPGPDASGALSCTGCLGTGGGDSTVTGPSIGGCTVSVHLSVTKVGDGKCAIDTTGSCTESSPCIYNISITSTLPAGWSTKWAWGPSAAPPPLGDPGWMDVWTNPGPGCATHPEVYLEDVMCDNTIYVWAMAIGPNGARASTVISLTCGECGSAPE